MHPARLARETVHHERITCRCNLPYPDPHFRNLCHGLENRLARKYTARPPLTSSQSGPVFSGMPRFLRRKTGPPGATRAIEGVGGSDGVLTLCGTIRSRRGNRKKQVLYRPPAGTGIPADWQKRSPMMKNGRTGRVIAPFLPSRTVRGQTTLPLPQSSRQYRQWTPARHGRSSPPMLSCRSELHPAPNTSSSIPR